VTSWDRHVPARSDPVTFAGRPPRPAAAPVTPAEFAGADRAPPSHRFDNGQRTRPHQPDQASSARGRPRAKRGRNLALAVVGVLILAGFAGIGYKLAGGHHTPPPSPGGQTGPSVAQESALIVRDYFFDINHHRFQAAYKLSDQSESYATFKAGFAGTKRDAVTITKTNGNVVTAVLKALQADGSVKTFEGTYTVVNGVITNPDVHLVSQSQPATS